MNGDKEWIRERSAEEWERAVLEYRKLGLQRPRIKKGLPTDHYTDPYGGHHGTKFRVYRGDTHTAAQALRDLVSNATTLPDDRVILNGEQWRAHLDAIDRVLAASKSSAPLLTWFDCVLVPELISLDPTTPFVTYPANADFVYTINGLTLLIEFKHEDEGSASSRTGWINTGQWSLMHQPAMVYLTTAWLVFYRDRGCDGERVPNLIAMRKMLDRIKRPHIIELGDEQLGQNPFGDGDITFRDHGFGDFCRRMHAWAIKARDRDYAKRRQFASTLAQREQLRLNEIPTPTSDALTAEQLDAGMRYEALRFAVDHVSNDDPRACDVLDRSKGTTQNGRTAAFNRLYRDIYEEIKDSGLYDPEATA